MAKGKIHTKQIHVYANWIELDAPKKVGILQAEQLRGKEVFSFSYRPKASVVDTKGQLWIANSQAERMIMIWVDGRLL
jgi:hypothetical protein